MNYPQATRKFVQDPEEGAAPASPTGRRAGYSSPSILARRSRILDETRRMLEESGGIANFSMDEVSRRADVAKRTLYNAFQSKERLVAAAIHQYFEDYVSRLTYTKQKATLEWFIERLVIVARRNLEIRTYTRALMNIYHAPDLDPDIRLAIHEIAAESHEPWIKALHSKRQLQPWIDPDELIATLVRYRYAVAHAWAEGLIPDDDFIVELVRGVLTFMAGATRGISRKQIEQALLGLADNTLLHTDEIAKKRRSD